jgi:hypothetical protein
MRAYQQRTRAQPFSKQAVLSAACTDGLINRTPERNLLYMY